MCSSNSLDSILRFVNGASAHHFSRIRENDKKTIGFNFTFIVVEYSQLILFQVIVSWSRSIELIHPQ